MRSQFHHIGDSTQAPAVLATFPFSRTPQGAHRDAKQLSCWPAISASLRSVIRSRDLKHSRPKTSRKTPRFVKWATNFRLLPYCASYPTRTALASLGNVGSQDRGPTGHDPSHSNVVTGVRHRWDSVFKPRATSGNIYPTVPCRVRCTTVLFACHNGVSRVTKTPCYVIGLPLTFC